MSNPIIASDVNVNVNTQPINVVVEGFSQVVGGSVGNLDGRYYPRYDNPSEYVSSGSLVNSVAGVNRLNGISGNVNISGTGGVLVFVNGSTIFVSGGNTTSSFVGLTGFNSGQYVTTEQTGQFYPASNPQQYIRSGDVSSTYATITNLQTTGSTLQSQISTINNSTGGILTYTNNISGILSDRLTNTGIFFINNYATAVNLQTTGQNLFLLLTGLSGQANLNYATIANLQSTGSNLWTFSLNNATNLSGRLALTGSNLQSQINNILLSGFLNNAVTGISVTGSNSITGLIRVAGIYGTIVGLSGNTITVSGMAGGGTVDLSNYYTRDNPSGYLNTLSGLSTGYVNNISGALSDRLTSTGANLLGLINASSAGVSSINAASGAINLIGAGNVSVSTSSQTITISGNTGVLINYINNVPRSGSFISVDSIKALRNLNVSGIDDNSKVHVKSYYDDSETFVTQFGNMSRDEGGGHFYWNANATNRDDSGRFIASNYAVTGRWERILEGGISNVHMWGAKGDAYVQNNAISGDYLIGSDDTIPIQNALSANGFGWGGTLRFPARNYKVTDTLYWYTQQTQLIGDGTTNSSAILMKENINKDIIITNAVSGILAWNANPTNPPISYSSYGADIPKIKDLSICYVGNAYLRGPDINGIAYSGINAINTGNSILTLAAVGEANLIQGCFFAGGKYAIRVLAGSPGLRAYGCTIAAVGEASVSMEGFPTQTSGATGWSAILEAGAGMLSLIDCSCDYNGLNSGEGGFSFVKAHNNSIANIYIKNLKLEGDYPGGVVNYIKPSGSEGNLSHIDINGLHWNGTTQNHAIDQTVVVISGQDSSVRNTVNTSLSNLYIQSVPNLIKDYILKDNTNNPYILKSDDWLGFPNYTQAVPTITHYGTKQQFQNYRGQSNFIFSNIKDTRASNHQVKFRPLSTGWYRIAIGRGISNVLFNDRFTINCQNNIYDLDTSVDYNTNPNSCRLSSKTANLNSSPITRARLWIEPLIPSGDTSDRAYLDIFFKYLPNSGVEYNNYETLKYVTIDTHTNHFFDRNNLITPICLSGFELNYISQNLTYPYAEVDLTKQNDISQSRPNVAKDAYQIDKDFYLFTTSNGDLRYFDAGLKLVFNGGGGANAAAQAVTVNGEIAQVLITNSGNGGYTSPPTITAVPNSLNNGNGAFLSGYIFSGFLRDVQVISGGTGYGVGPDSVTDGYSLTGIGLTGQTLYNLINGLSGQLNITGGNLQSQINTLFNNLLITGRDSYNNAINLSGNLQSTGSKVWNDSNNNAINLSGRISVTGSTLDNKINTVITNLLTTGRDAWNNATNLSGNLFNSGSLLNNAIIGVSGNLQTTGSTLDNKINSLSGYVTGVSGGLQSQLNNYYLKSNPDGYAQSGNFISGISISGGNAIRGAININAGSNITLTQLGNTLSIASMASGMGGGGVTGIGITGGISLTGLIRFTSAGNVTITQAGNDITISGNTTSSSGLPFAIGNVNITSGIENSQFIQFTQNFSAVPIVLGNIFNNSGNNIVGFQTSGISTSGFYLNLTEALTTNNYYFQYLATTGLGFFNLATSLIGQVTAITSGPQLYCGSGNPEGIQTATSGSIWTDWFNQVQYNKYTGTGPYGWA